MSSVEEAQQLERIREFMKSYGTLIFVGIIVAIISYVGWSYWQKKQVVSSEIRTAKVQQLIADAGQTDDTTALSGFVATADQISSEAPDSAQAIQAQLTIAHLAYERKDYASAEKALTQVAQSKNEDKGLLAIVKLRLANAQFAQDKLDDALATLNSINEASFIPSVEERKGDVYVAKNDIEQAKTAYQKAWDSLVLREESNAILALKLESVGIKVDAPYIPQPVLALPDAPARQ